MLHSANDDSATNHSNTPRHNMSPQQKYAVFNLLVALLAMVGYFACLPFIGPWRATGAFWLLGFCGVSAFLLARERFRGCIVDDEREQQIWVRATIAAKSVVWVALVAAFLVALQTIGSDGLVSMHWLAFGIWWAFGIF